MLDTKKVREAEQNIRSYLADGLVKKERFRDIVFQTYMRNHRESLFVARKLLHERISPLWSIVISYYSMFYIANALLYQMGYKIGTKIAHKVTIDALIVLCRKKIADMLLDNYQISCEETLALSDNLLEQYDLERLKRSRFQYESTEEIKMTKASTSLQRAMEFSKEIEKMLL